MDFVSNVLDSMPVVGHVKGVIHYAVGDTDGGNKAMYQSTRTSAVLAGGAAGAFLGPGGAAVGAMYAGMVTDGLATAAFDEPQGLLQSCINISEDLSAGRNPSGSILSTGMRLGFDALGGLGMGVSGASSKVTEKAATNAIEKISKKVVTTFGEEIFEKPLIFTTQKVAKILFDTTVEQAVRHPDCLLISAHITLTASKRQEDEKIAEERKWEKERKGGKKKERCPPLKEKEQSASKEPHSSGSSQPPNNYNNNKAKEESEQDYLAFFMKLLQVLLNLIYGNKMEPFSRIFRNLTAGDIEYLEKVINILYKFGTLDVVIELVIRMFKDHLSNDISFPNFLSLLEFVQAFINDELNRRLMNSKGTEKTRSKMKYKERRAKLITEITSQTDIVGQMKHMFMELQNEIRLETGAWNNIISPYFRDMFSAVSHYFKHRCVPGDGMLTVKQYFDFIRKFLPGLKGTPEYRLNFRSLKRPKEPVTIVYEVYVATFGRRFRIVVKRHGGYIVLSSGLVVTRRFPNDKEGDVFVEVKISKRKPKKT